MKAPPGPIFGGIVLLFPKLCAILDRLFDKREVDDAGRTLRNRSSAWGRSLQPIENTQNQREYLWGNLEKFANSLQLSSLGFNKIKSLAKSKPQLRFDSELFFGLFGAANHRRNQPDAVYPAPSNSSAGLLPPLGVAMTVVDGFR